MSKALKYLRTVLRKGLGLDIDVANTRRHLDETKMLIAKSLIQQQSHSYERLSDAEFKVFSQFGDDGIIQYLIRRIPIESKMFIEFGVEDYTESNTRLLLMANGWKGLVIDGSDDYVRFIRNDEVYWQHDITAISRFVTSENINDTFSEQGFEGEIGVLSIDIDGNDYHVWQAIRVVTSVVVIVEYNSVFGAKHAITIPYDPGFSRLRAHYSSVYWGASLKALCLLGEKKGYAFVGSNSAGNNAYFIRRDKLGDLKVLTSEEGYVQSNMRESRDRQGQLTFVGGTERIKLIQDMPVYDVERGVVCKIRDLPR